jgi:hypothetical protein
VVRNGGCAALLCQKSGYAIFTRTRQVFTAGQGERRDPSPSEARNAALEAVTSAVNKFAANVLLVSREAHRAGASRCGRLRRP